MSDLYKRIESLCKERKTNITEMCRVSGAPRGSLSDLKAGRITRLNSTTLGKIASHFNVSVDYLLGANYNLQLFAEDAKKPASDGDELCMSDAELLEAFRNAPEYKKDAIRDLLGLK